jgi:hypothetical protein
MLYKKKIRWNQKDKSYHNRDVTQDVITKIGVQK